MDLPILPSFEWNFGNAGLRVGECRGRRSVPRVDSVTQATAKTESITDHAEIEAASRIFEYSTSHTIRFEFFRAGPRGNCASVGF
jgi:hypothetical protein